MSDDNIELDPIERPPAYSDGKVCDPSQLEGRDVPERQWLVKGMIPEGTVTLFTGDGGVGKSLLMQQLCTATALGHDWLGIPTKACRSFALFCEDDNEELHRRQVDICNATTTPLSDISRFSWKSGVGDDNVLMHFDQRNGVGTLTDAFNHLMAVCVTFDVDLVVIDTLADTYGGNEIIRPQVRTFINGCLGRICKETGATVVLCGHPSQAGKASGDGFSGSTAWNNSVRSRLYLTKPKDEDADPTERILSTMKSNYGPTGETVELHWRHGVFVPVQKFTGEIGRIDENNHKKAFLNCLDALTNRGSTVSESRNSATYAPKVMAKMPESERSKLRELEKAMPSLFTSGEIVNEPYGPPSRMRNRIARKLVESETQ